MLQPKGPIMGYLYLYLLLLYCKKDQSYLEYIHSADAFLAVSKKYYIYTFLLFIGP